jgi:hypothetical protein
MPNSGGLSHSEPAITPSPGNWEAALVRVEGKIDRLIDGLARQAEDTKTIRERLHDHANHITALTTLDIPGKLTAMRERLDGHDLRLAACETERTTEKAQRQGAVATMKVVWAVIGFFGAGGVAAIVAALMKLAH